MPDSEMYIWFVHQKNNIYISVWKYPIKKVLRRMENIVFNTREKHRRDVTRGVWDSSDVKKNLLGSIRFEAKFTYFSSYFL